MFVVKSLCALNDSSFTCKYANRRKTITMQNRVTGLAHACVCIDITTIKYDWFAMRVIKLILISVVVHTEYARVDEKKYISHWRWFMRRNAFWIDCCLGAEISSIDSRFISPGIRMLTDFPYGYRLLCIVFFFLGIAVNQMRQSNLIFTTCNWCRIKIKREKTTHTKRTKWISIHTARGTDVKMTNARPPS